MTSLHAQEPSALQAALALEKLLQDAIARAEKSVVAIARVRNDAADPAQAAAELIPSLPGAIAPTDPDFIPNDFGAGVVIDPGGLIITNYHVVGDPTTSEHYVWTERRPYKAQVIAADPWTDLAVLKIAATGLKRMPLGDGSRVRKGQIVIALGNPHAIARDGEVSASWGIISNLLRRAPRDPDRVNNAGKRDTLHHFGTLIQTDAKLNLGFSGGALINLQGEMVGLTVSYTAAAGYESTAGFAIPVNQAFRRTMETLQRGRKPEFGFLGVELEPIALELRQSGVIGARLTNVIPATPAFRADLRAGDVISRINGEPVRNDDDLIRLVSSLPPETEAEFTIIRGNLQNGRTRSVTKPVLLSKKSVASVRPLFGTAPERSWRGSQVEFVTASPDFRSLAHLIDAGGCVRFSHVERDSPAWRAGLRLGMLATHVQRRRIRTPSDFYEAVNGDDGEVRIRILTTDGTSDVRTISP